MSKTTQFFILTVQNNSLEKNLMVLFLIWSIIRFSLWAEDLFWYHLAGITLMVIFIKYMILTNRKSMIDIFKMGLAVKTGVQIFICLSTILSKEGCYTERLAVHN